MLVPAQNPVPMSTGAVVALFIGGGLVLGTAVALAVRATRRSSPAPAGARGGRAPAPSGDCKFSQATLVGETYSAYGKVGVARREGWLSDRARIANEVYWEKHPDCPRQIDPHDPDHRCCLEAWARIHDKVVEIIDRGDA